MLSKIFEFIKGLKKELILVAIIVLLSLFSFSVGYIIAKLQEKTPLQFKETN